MIQGRECDWSQHGLGWECASSLAEKHVMPLNDLRPHEFSASCWCRPFVDGDQIFVHNSLDGREAYETGKLVMS